MRRTIPWILAGVALACDGKDAAYFVGAPPELVPDPAVETTCTTSPPPPGKTRAKHVSCDDELVAGRLAVGRPGDILLENSQVRVILRGPGDGYALHGTTGGGILDAAPHGGEDLIKEIQPLVDVNVGAFDEIVITEAGDDGPATVVVRGPARLVPLIEEAVMGTPVEVLLEQHYILAPDRPAVEMHALTYPLPGKGPVTAGIMDALFLGGRIQTFLPGKGFVDSETGPFIASAGTTSSYGLVYPRESQSAIQFLVISNLRFARGPNVKTGDKGTSRFFVIGDGSVESVTRTAWEIYGEPLGTIKGTTAPGVDVVVLDGSGAAVTVARADDTGAYEARVPAGLYTVRAESPGRATGEELPATVAAGATVTVNPVAGPGGFARVIVEDDQGTPIPARVHLTAPGVDRLTATDATGEVLVPLPAGTYSLTVARGVEYEAYTNTGLVVADGVTTDVPVTLARVVDTDGWLALDTHLHSEMSTDSTIPLDDRLRAVAAEGVELAISTDHDFVTDYTPVIVELGLSDWVATMTGEESSSFILGHINGWPLPVDVSRPGQGAVAWFKTPPGDVFDLLRDGDPTRVVQVNHPRRSGSALFQNIDLDPVNLVARADPALLGVPGADLNDWDFDAIEVANAKSTDTLDLAFTDWLAFLVRGLHKTATGSSDSHGASAYAGRSRTYVYVGPGNDDPATVDTAAVNVALKAGRAMVSQGAFVEAWVLEPQGGTPRGPGEVADATGATEVTLRVRVQAAPWQPLKEIVVYDRDQAVMTIPLDTGETRPVRYEGALTMPVAADTFFIVRVESAGPGTPVLSSVAPSFTNPVYVDVDGDGTFTP